MADKALAQARQAPKEIEAGFCRGPLHGVPVALKDLCFTADTPAACGMPLLAGHLPGYDATIVTILKRAGAVILGKLGTVRNFVCGRVVNITRPLPFNGSGHPSLTLPGGFGANGISSSFQLIGRHFEESLLFRAGHAFQQITDWHTRHPDL